ncbi:hypothetical protein [Allomuricauda sp. SCSIO 65647]|uniref:hypothetical protein n=1 Tax=Allomuricauda sp. SCSIO 65647 TaxID=2908843 RepID=UPI001F1E17D8|nr:hypothetical protein [Muricauda sp. SCSIO 65647]UJH67712.1 hypothetical protein L0P89_00490 [Muricauda sp. SCSIO 65647]
MKQVIGLFIIVFLFIPCHAQKKSEGLSHYVFPEFTVGEVLMKSGVKNVAVLNYNAASEEMIFDEKGNKMAITSDQVKQIDTVIIDNRRFVQYDGRFLELMSGSEPEFYIEHKCHIKYPGRIDGPGGRTSQTSGTETYSFKNNASQIYNVILPMGYDTKPYRYYWIRKNGELKKLKSLKQLAKLYPDKKNDFKNLVKKHNADFDDPKSVIELVQHLEAN